MISPKHLHRNLNMELVTRCRCHHHITSVWPCAATWWWVGIRHFCYNAQSAHYSRCCALSTSSVQLQCRRMMCAALCGRGASTELFVWCLGRIRMKDWEWGSGPAHTSTSTSTSQHSGPRLGPATLRWADTAARGQWSAGHHGLDTAAVVTILTSWMLGNWVWTVVTFPPLPVTNCLLFHCDILKFRSSHCIVSTTIPCPNPDPCCSC